MLVLIKLKVLNCYIHRYIGIQVTYYVKFWDYIKYLKWLYLKNIGHTSKHNILDIVYEQIVIIFLKRLGDLEMYNA